jgi:hypothetical protein
MIARTTIIDNMDHSIKWREGADSHADEFSNKRLVSGNMLDNSRSRWVMCYESG